MKYRARSDSDLSSDYHRKNPCDPLAKSMFSITLHCCQADYKKWVQAIRKEDTIAIFEAWDSFRDDGLECLVNKLKSDYGNDFYRYMLNSAVQAVEQQMNSINHTMENGGQNLPVQVKLVAYQAEVKHQKEFQIPISKKLERR